MFSVTPACERCVNVVCNLLWLDQGHAIESLKAAFSATKASEAYSSAEPRNCAPVLRAGPAGCDLTRTLTDVNLHSSQSCGDNCRIALSAHTTTMTTA